VLNDLIRRLKNLKSIPASHVVKSGFFQASTKTEKPTDAKETIEDTNDNIHYAP
jgi:hypothetical protein